jgi:hypothetical protein
VLPRVDAGEEGANLAQLGVEALPERGGLAVGQTRRTECQVPVRRRG